MTLIIAFCAASALQILWDSDHHFILHRPMNKHQMATTFSFYTFGQVTYSRNLIPMFHQLLLLIPYPPAN